MKQINVGIIGLDTSHAVQFTRSLNQPHPLPEHQGCRVVAAYPEGSREILSSASRIAGYTADVQNMGVKIVSSIEELLEQVDAVLLETNDGRLRLKQILPVLKSGKAIFIDKPVAASLSDVFLIYQLAEHFQVPVFSASTLRFTPGLEKAISGELGQILGCDTYSPCPLEPTHPDLFWYGIHGVELLLTIMGAGCLEVSRVHTLRADIVTARWEDGRLGTYRGRRDEQGNYFSGFGGTIHSDQGIYPVGRFVGYEPLLNQVVKFFQTRQPPVSADQTLTVYEFMAAADLSKQRHGNPATLSEVRQTAKQQAEDRFSELLKSI